MEPPGWDQVEAIFSEAVELPPDTRAAFLDRVCADNALLRSEVEALLDVDMAEFALGLESRVRNGRRFAPKATGELHSGDHVGPYRVEEEIGRGGMGHVYRVARADGVFEKEVALKLVKRGMDTDEVLARFRRERQVLAGLDHPGIARLLDGGAADDGRPYLVMELVEGEPITRYCYQQGLGVEARLSLFEQVGEAVQHAHRRLVVHRDLKPSNILVSDEGEVKLLDFGIAKLLEPGDDEALTEVGGGAMTPAYAAPEQHRGEVVTTAADIYALGVILYELLTGKRPEVQDGTPIKPPSGSIEDQALRRRLRGDLDGVVLKALREEPDARYSSVEALLDDLRRYRTGQPVLARRGSLGYRARKFVARHRVAVSAGAAFVVLLTAAVVALALQQRQTAHERDRAEAAAAQAREATRFIAGVFEEAVPARTGGDSLTVLEALERGLTRAERELVDEPELLAQLLYLFGDTYLAMNEYDRAIEACGRAAGLQRSLYGPVHPDLASTLFCLGASHYQLGNTTTSNSQLGIFEAIMGMLPEEVSPEQALRFRFMGRLLEQRADHEGALDSFRRSHDLFLRLYGFADRRSITSGFDVVGALVELDRTDEALPLLDELRAAIDRLSWFEGEGERLHAFAATEQARLYNQQGRWAEASQSYREAIALRRALDPDSPIIASLLLSSSQPLVEAGRHAEAEEVLREGHEGFAQRYGAAAFYTLHAQRLLGDAIRRQGRFAEAESLLEEAFTGLQAARGTEDSFTQGAIGSLIALYEAWGRPDDVARFQTLASEAPASEQGNAGS